MGGEPMSIERIPTHVEGLDENIQGGIPEGHIAIVAGS
ncbi:MAG TPA: KaiC domain-containing protein, partial [Candidatus Poseidoniaceae archaeon]|nr:KaiC domain-containing protein [Candidatus Poseidoniaceae archaeon]